MSVRHYFFLIAGLLLQSAAASPATEKSHAYFRFTPTRLRDSSTSNSVQVAEFRLKLRGQNLDMSAATITNPGGNSPAGEGVGNLGDGDPATKWLDTNKGAAVFRFPAPVTVDAYAFTTANDASERDPGNWHLEASDDGITWILLSEVVNGTVPTTRLTATADFPLSYTVPPYASFWHPEYLLKWTPAGDSAAPFNRAGVPLKIRSTAENVNANARPGEGKVTVLSTFGATSFNPSATQAVEHTNAYTGWQYTDRLVFWGGSAGEGLILAPKAPVIDVAHRNGVPVLGNVFLAPTAYGGKFAWVQAFLKKTGSSFPVADKLIEVARYYGFDGWFINQETAGGNTTTATDMRDFISYFRSQAPDLQIMWYDAMTESGSVSWQNALTANNDMFVSYSAQPVAHSMFLNFSWSSSGLTSSRTRAQSLAVDPYAIYAGVDVEANGSNTGVNWEGVFPTGQAHKLSLAFYGAQWMFNNAANSSAFQANEIRFWSGANADPSNTTTSSAWKGLANYIPATTPLQSLPFVTNFNRGQGNRFAVEGSTVATGGWSNLSLQDVLPTWRWIVSSTGSKLVPSLELDDAYSGGTSLKIAGTLDATNDLKLYAARLPVSASTVFKLVYKSAQGAGPTAMQVALAFEDAPQAFVYLDVGNAASSGWGTASLPLAAYAGRKITTIGLRFASAATLSNYQMRIGRMAVLDGAVSTPAAATNLRVLQQDPLDGDSMALRIAWDASATSGIYYYQVYQNFADGSRKWLGATPSTAFAIPYARRKAAEAALAFSVQAVGADFGMSSMATMNAVLPPAPDTKYALTGTWIGTPGSWSNLGDTGDKAFDGNTATFFDAQEESAWTGLDFGSGHARRITAIRYFPRPGWAYRTTGGVFEGANAADFSDAAELATVLVDPADGAYTIQPVTRPGLFRYFRFRSTGHGNIAELKVYGYELPALPAGLAAELGSQGASLSWNTAAWASAYRIERAPTAGGPFTPLATVTAASYLDSAVPAGQQPYYRVIATNPAGESAASAAVQTQPADPWLAWQLSHFGTTEENTAGPEADPEHDGMPNLVEYAMGTDPLAASLPGPQPSFSGGTLSLVYAKDPAASGVTLVMQWSDNLTDWSEAGVSYASLAGSQVRAGVAAGAGMRFVRLVARQP